MPDSQCVQAMELLNQVFGSGLIFNDGHEILARLENGDDVGDIVADLGRKFGEAGTDDVVTRVVESWPPLQLQLVSQAVRWALAKLDTDDRVTIKWRGDAESPQTVTKFELRDHELVIEFAHPPAGISSEPAAAPA